jgi:signal transduction histidine kinase
MAHPSIAAPEPSGEAGLPPRPSQLTRGESIDRAAVVSRNLPPGALGIALLAAAYVAAGRVGLLLDAVSGFAALVWAPTGLSLAALLLLGNRLWPGVAVGALVVNVWAGAPLAVATGIAVGNTLEALLGVYLVRRIPGFQPELRRVRDVMGLILLAAGLSTVVSATLGVTSLALGGLILADQLGVTWMSWWLGDATGALVVAPVVLTWGSVRGRWLRSRIREALALGVALASASALVFLGGRSGGPVMFLQPYILYAPLIWASLRFLTPGAATATFVVSAVAVAGTVLGSGPFLDGELHERLWALQAFIGLIAVTFLVLGALAEERRESERALLRAKEVAESASGAKSRFLAVMSHELRTPLTSIVGFADLLESEIAGPMGTLQKRHASRIRGAAWHLVSIIDGILAFSRAEAGQETVELQTVDAGAITEEVMALLEPQAAAKGITLRILLESAPDVRTDAGKLRQILLNLVSNAVKFSEDGVVEIEATQEGGRAIVRVRDQGPGIPEDQLRRIFEPFSQVRSNVNDVSTGTGLGLTVASMLAELLGGALTVESVVGEGSTFTLRLPLEGPGARASIKDPPGDHRGSPRLAGSSSSP